jgi:hypothetical protein
VKRTVLLLALLAGCSSPPSGKPEDETLARLRHAGDTAYNLERPEEAAAEYRAALVRARERDDGAAIDDAGFNLATAQLRAGQPQAALQTARDIQAELARRRLTDPTFALVTATAMFRLGDLAGADQVAAGLAGASPELVNAAWFLRGLIADARGDRTGLERAAGALSPGADPADALELRARLAHDPAQAMQAADLRREALDYRGMARALALAAQFTPDTATSADLYLRAGRSAAAQGDAPQARLWLGEARAGNECRAAGRGGPGAAQPAEALTG